MIISDEHKDASKLATGAIMDLISRGHMMQAAVIRGASPEEIETMRSEAHSVLDAFLDHTTAAATHVRAVLKT
ncbi:hypothetical protein [Brevundimonas sp. Root1279]|uniref:hypothetical protein n=1 Tax=Brevundimonas sp. Root1279 TaxID=1736443 RepID=UPI0006F4B70E|nr:hypothetical protein [Brevundimonas sp. Root1279]KQW79719.1 hypothetical protein ASC65_14315 [Brevundimonas sp. Root1279]